MWQSSYNHTITGVITNQLLRLYVHLGPRQKSSIPQLPEEARRHWGTRVGTALEHVTAGMVAVADYHLISSCPHSFH